MSKNPGYVLRIKEGQYAGKKAIAYHSRQQKTFRDRNQLVCTVFEDDDFQKKIGESILINVSKISHIGFCD